MSGRKAVLVFYAVMGLVAVITIAIIGVVGKRTPDERAQRDLARTLPSVYQKYYIDNKQWPSSAREAAIHFRSESPKMLDRVKDAEQRWGLTCSVQNPDTPTSNLTVEYSSPQPQTLHFLLEKVRK